MNSNSIKIIITLSTLLLSPYLFANTNANSSQQTANTPDYETIDLKQLSQQQIANYLRWVPQQDLHCKGYFQDPASVYNHGDINNSAIKITTDWSQISQVGTSLLMGNVELSQPGRQISADKIYITRNEEGNIEYADLYGNIYYQEPGRLIVSDKARINLQDKSGTLYHNLYRTVTLDFKNQPDISNKHLTHDEMITLVDLSAWGTADKITRDSAGVIDIYDGTYSTCPPKNEVWSVKASHLNLNQETGRGTATHAWFYLKDMPLAYFPYLNFPIDKQRKTGFLLPIVGHSTNDGFTFALPFYWNLAPNYDATITPNYMQLRGLQMNGEFRYLTETGEGNFHGRVLPHDRAFRHFRDHLLEETASEPDLPGRDRLIDTGDNRYLVSLNDIHNYNRNWSSYIYLNQVSDDYYFQDFNDDPMQTIENQILNQAELRYLDEHWNFLTRLQGYQTLHPLDQLNVANQYKKLPELILNGAFPDAPGYLDLQLNNSAVYFDKTQSPWINYEPVTGSRVNINPVVSMPLYWASGFVNPQIQLSETNYDLHNQNARFEIPLERLQERLSVVTNPITIGIIQNRIDEIHDQFKSNHINRVLPIASLDSGLFFDRDFKLFGTPYQQTLEPRLFYLYVPYTNQNDIPLFDTSLQPFSYDQLFRTNRFNGLDRIGDANQVTLALTSRLLKEESGQEKITASIGQIIYFANRKVLSPAQELYYKNILLFPDELPKGANVSTLNNPSPTAPTSPLAGQLAYHFNEAWRLISNVTWDSTADVFDNGSLILQYAADDKHLMNFSIVYLRAGDPVKYTNNPLLAENDLYQTDFSVYWPIAQSWSGVARWNYNISHGFTQNALAGIEYDSCCWAVRLMGGREFRYQKVNPVTQSSHPRLDNQIFIEFALKGLGNVSSKSPHRVLTDTITGYNDTFGLD